MNTKTPAWIPLLPSHQLRAAQDVVAACAEGEELALWRSAEGVAQVWEDRCPHRGMRLSLGRVHEGRLACAYHGWEYEADGGRCGAIPAQPGAPLPRNLCVKAHAALDHGGMVWTHLGGAAAAPTEQADAQATTFCRSLAIRAGLGPVSQALADAGFEAVQALVWRGELAREAIAAYLTPARDGLTFLHAWARIDAQHPAFAAVMAALRRLRASIEAAR